MITEQKALFIETPGNGEWKVRTRDIQKPRPGEVLVQIHSTALNPVDWKIRSFDFFVKEYPAILGSDASGTIAELGEGVTNFQKGDKVFCQGYFNNEKGTFQQYVTVPAEIVAKIPFNLTFDQAASVPLGLATAVQGFYGDRESSDIPSFTPPWVEGGLGKYSGEPVVIFGGSTSVGQYAIQIARLSGFSPIITTSSPHNASLCQSLGATHVIDRSSPSVVSEIKEILGNREPKLVYDSISGKETQEQAWDIVASGGVLALTLEAQIDAAKNPSIHIFNIFGNVHTDALRNLGASLYSKITQLLEEGAIVPNRVEALPKGLDGIPAGLERMQANKVSGVKLIAHPLES